MEAFCENNGDVWVDLTQGGEASRVCLPAVAVDAIVRGETRWRGDGILLHLEPPEENRGYYVLRFGTAHISVILEVRGDLPRLLQEAPPAEPEVGAPFQSPVIGAV